MNEWVNSSRKSQSEYAQQEIWVEPVEIVSAKWNFSNHNDSRFLSTICSVASLPILEPVELILLAFFLEIYLKC